MTKSALIISLGLAALLTACSSTTFLRYEAREDVIFEGAGGARTVVDGIDFWEQGQPPRKYRLLGYIKDERSNGLIHRLTMRGDVASNAKARGGDAVIILGSETTLTGVVNSGFGGSTTTYASHTAYTAGSGSTFSVPVSRREGSFAVLKYVD